MIILKMPMLSWLMVRSGQMMKWYGMGSVTSGESEMEHLDQSSKGGIKDILSGLVKPRKILIHINNTNPILDGYSDERKQLDDLGIEVAYDGMDILL